MNLYEKLVEIRKTIDGFTKDTTGFQYKYVSGTQVLGKIINKMNELKVLLVPSVTPNTLKYDIFEYDTVTKKGEQKHNIDYLTQAEMVMTWINAEEPNERLNIPFAIFGQQDEISKSFGSGLTYSERYFLMKFFGQPTDADDPDTKQNTINYTNNYTLTDKQVARLYAIGKNANLTTEQITTTIKKELGKDVNQLTKTEYDAYCKRLEKAGTK